MRVLHADLVRVFGLLVGLRRERRGAVAHLGQRVHIHRCALVRQSFQQFTGGFAAGQLDGHGGDHRTIVEPLTHFEHVGARGGVARPDGTLRRSRAAPFRQIGEMQVVPAQRYRVEHSLGRMLP